MADTIFTTQLPNTTGFDAITHHLGVEFTVSANGNCTGGRARKHSTGFPTTFFWQLWRVSDSALLAECNLNLLADPSPGAAAWVSFTSANFITPGNVALVTGQSYIVNVFLQGGDFVYLTPFTYPINSGTLSASIGRFLNGSPRATIPTSGDTNAAFFADVEFTAGNPRAVTGRATAYAGGTSVVAKRAPIVGHAIGLALPTIVNPNVRPVTGRCVGIAIARNRPSTTQPAAGTVARPNTGLVVRPYTGVVPH